MPELPEVETTRRGIEPHMLHQTITDVIVRDHRLRWPVAQNLAQELVGQSVNRVKRRAKYLLLHLDSGVLILHLGMSGSLRLVHSGTPAEKHDHVDLVLASAQSLRLKDPRRFGSLHWTEDAESHFLIKPLGPEPLSAGFDGAYLHARSRQRRVAVKEFIMNAHVVVGVGNIYASESLFRARIHPFRAAGQIGRERYERLASSIKTVLDDAIAQGGTTLRDFTSSDGKPGYFAQSLSVYGREGEDCLVCGNTVQMKRRGQRATFFCPSCQRQ